MRRAFAVIVVLLGLAAGCASEREQNLKRYDAMHESIRTAPADKPTKWEMNPGAK